MSDPTRRQFHKDIVGLVALPLGTTCGSSATSGQPTLSREKWEPAYLALERSGQLARRAAALREIYRSCRLCPRQCGVNRSRGEKGICRSTDRARVYVGHPHFGEERELTGRSGSGTIFFSNCNLLCVYCQNWEIAHRGDGAVMSDVTLAKFMTELQNLGCHNINLVTPTHIVPNIVSALPIAIARGLRLPLVYNCGGYESLEVIRLLDGIVDIYLPDFKYADGAKAAKYSTGARDYPEVAAGVIEEMYRQVGNLVTDEKGIALRGLMIRHLVLPDNIAGTDQFVRFVARRLSKSTYVNIMAQYRPEHHAREYPEIARRVTSAEFNQAVRWAQEAGLTNLAMG